MADIRIRQLPDGSGPVASDYIPLDNGTTRRATVQQVVEIGRPTASQAEAEAGVEPTKVMTPLAVKQSIAVNAASPAQGAKADSALQPSDIGTSVASASQGAKADTAMQPPVYDPQNIGGDAFDRKNWGEFDTRAQAAAATIPTLLDAVRINGDASVGDGLGGLYVDIDNGSSDTFVSAGGTSRTWYRAADVGTQRIADEAVTTPKIADGSVSFAKIGTDVKASATVLLTVGAGGQFSTIGTALEAASKLKIRTYVFGGFTVEVRLLAGFQMAEQVYVSGLDLSYVTITSVAAEVTIVRSALTTIVDGGSDSDYPAFSAMNGGRLPVINVLFNMNATGSATGRSFMYVKGVGSTGYVGQGKGCKNPGARGLEARYQAVIHAHQAIFTGAGDRALYALHQGRIFAEYANCDDCLGGIGVYALMGGEIMFTNGSVKNKVNTGPAIWANRGGKIIATQANADNCQSTSLTDGAVYASDGGEIVFDSGIATNSDGNGIAAVWGGKISARFADTSGAAQDGFYVVDGGTCDGTQATASNCGRNGFYSSDLSNLNARGATATGCQKAAQADWGGRINARQATFTGGTSQGVAAQRGGYINIGLGNAQRGGAPAATDIVVATNGKIDAAGATGGLSQAANTITSAGLINQ